MRTIFRPEIYDCFPFFQELDLLEIRLNELYEIVHRFVLVESPFTHQGNPKPLYYADNKKRFEKFNDKIIHVVEDFHDTAPAPWAREQAQRNRIAKVLDYLGGTDVMIVSDLDEIPRASRVIDYCNSFLTEPELSYLHMRFFYYFLNCEFKNVPWDRGFISPASLLKGQNLTHLRTCYSRLPKMELVLGKIELVERSVLKGKEKDKDNDEHRWGNTSGWHFSYAGGEDRIIEKLRAFAHTEFNTNTFTNKDYIHYTMERGTGLTGTEKYSVVPIDGTFPKFVQDNLEAFKQKGLIKI
jgi:beta-1,4-mannosyl-glycoprotein beta-1,4-N-acetylglucosaminyltransferase